MFLPSRSRNKLNFFYIFVYFLILKLQVVKTVLDSRMIATT